MMSEPEPEVELEEAEVVDVTGTEHNDEGRRRGKKKRCGCSPSLRDTTLLIFLGLLVIYVVAVIVENVVMKASFEELEIGECERSINRVSVVIATEMASLQELVQQYSFWDDCVEVTQDHSIVEDFILDNFMLNETAFNTDLQINYIGFYDNVTFKAWWSVYYPPPEDNSAQVAEGDPSDLTPEINSGLLKSVLASLDDPTEGWQHIMTPNAVKELFIISVEPIMLSTVEGDDTVYGYLIAGRNLKPRLQSFANNVPTCLAVETRDSDGQYWDDTDRKMFNKVKKGSFNEDNTHAGKPVFTKREVEMLNKSKLRVCPEEGVNETEEMMTGYFELCDMDPEEGIEVTCVKMRLDNPMSMMEQGSPSVTVMSICICVLMVILCLIFVVFLDCVVLRPIVNLSKVLEKQADWEEDDLDDEAFVTIKKDKSATDIASGSFSKSNTRDEIVQLKRAMEQNASTLRKRLKAVDRELRAEQRKTMRHRQAIQLLNLWRGHTSFFPGLRPNAMQLRYEPPRTVEDLLSNPLAIEFLKSHCETDNTLENLWFLVDVSWLDEMEKSRDGEPDQDRRKQIQDVVACAAETIIERYIAVNAPQLINISSEACEKLRGRKEYERGMFSEAVHEVKATLTMDVMPRFQQTTLFSAMSEALFLNTPGGDADETLSDDTLSTAASILTDDAEDDGGVAQVFAKTFKNLRTNFVPGADSEIGSTASTGTSDIEEAQNPALDLKGEGGEEKLASTTASSPSDDEDDDDATLSGTEESESAPDVDNPSASPSAKPEEEIMGSQVDELVEPLNDEPVEQKMDEPHKEDQKKALEFPNVDTSSSSSSSSSSESSSSSDLLTNSSSGSS